MPTHAPATPVRAVLFDYGLVLSGPPDPAAWATMKKSFGADEDRFHVAYWAPRPDYDRGALNGDTYWRRVAELLHYELNPQQHEALLQADIALWTQPNQPMIAWAAALQAAGVRTGILSNLGDAMERGVLAQLPWMADFAHSTFSHRLGIAKPDPAIYLHAAQGLRVVPEAVLFVDDRADNIAAAREVGMQAIQYTSHEAFVHAMHQDGLASLLTPSPNV